MSANLLEMSLQAEEKFFTQSQAHIWKSELPRSRRAFVYLCEGTVAPGQAGFLFSLWTIN
jgi:hypothetical protein